MNSTTIHFVHETSSQISTNQSNTYSWSMDNGHLPIQQLHYVEPNLALINSSSTKSMSLIQMSALEPASIGHHLTINAQSTNNSQTNSSNSSNSITNLLPNSVPNAEDNQMTYLTPLINVSLGDQTKSNANKQLPPAITIEAINSSDYQQVNYYDNLSSTTLPSMAASFGSNSMTNMTHCTIQNSSIIHRTSNVINNVNKQTKLKSNVKATSKVDWTSYSRPGRRPKLNESKPVKFDSISNLSKGIKKANQLKETKIRKRLSNQLVNQLNGHLNQSNARNQRTLANQSISNNDQSNQSSTRKPTGDLISLSNAPNNLCNLNSICSANLNHSNNSIRSTNSMCSMNSLNSSLCSSTHRKTAGKRSSNLPESVKRRNLRERMRVMQLNSGFQHLRTKLPNSNKKMSKVQTLRCATQYIKDLLQMLNQPSIGYSNCKSSFESTSVNRTLSAIDFKNQLETCKTEKLVKSIESRHQLSHNLHTTIEYYDTY